MHRKYPDPIGSSFDYDDVTTNEKGGENVAKVKVPKEQRPKAENGYLKPFEDLTPRQRRRTLQKSRRRAKVKSLLTRKGRS